MFNPIVRALVSPVSTIALSFSAEIYRVKILLGRGNFEIYVQIKFYTNIYSEKYMYTLYKAIILT